jgi:hypothetical protein
MSSGEPEHYETNDSELLKGTTLTVYRFMFKKGVPLRPRDLQVGLGLSSSSVAHYHLQKLLGAGLVQEQANGYVVSRVYFEDMIRIRRILIPIQTTLVAFFSTAIVLMLSVLRPPTIFSGYVFGVVVAMIALGAATTEVVRVLHGTR